MLAAALVALVACGVPTPQEPAGVNLDKRLTRVPPASRFEEVMMSDEPINDNLVLPVENNPPVPPTDHFEAMIYRGETKDKATRDIAFPIDFVFTWYNSADEDGERERISFMKKENPVGGEDNLGPSRYQDVGELKYAIRSVEKYAPWARRIFLVMADHQPVPSWLNRDGKVKVVRHSEIFTEDNVMPTYSSVAIESVIHRIAGLSEHFIYSNDDFFFGAPVSPQMFFTPDGKVKVWFDRKWQIDRSAKYEEMHDIMELNALEGVGRALQERRIAPRNKKVMTSRLRHIHKALTRSMMAEIASVLPSETRATRSSRFRSRKSMYSISAASNYCYQTYKCEEGVTPPYYATNVDDQPFDEIRQTIHDQKPTLICLNNGVAVYATEMVSLLDSMFPEKCSSEK